MHGVVLPQGLLLSYQPRGWDDYVGLLVAYYYEWNPYSTKKKGGGVGQLHEIIKQKNKQLQVCIRSIRLFSWLTFKVMKGIYENSKVKWKLVWVSHIIIEY